MNRYQFIAQDESLEADLAQVLEVDLAQVLAPRNLKAAMAIHHHGFRGAAKQLGVTMAAMGYRWDQIQQDLRATGNPSLIGRIWRPPFGVDT